MHVLLIRKIEQVNMLLRVNRSIHWRRESAESQKKRNKQSHQRRESKCRHETGSGNWNLHSKGRGDSRLMQQRWTY